MTAPRMILVELRRWLCRWAALLVPLLLVGCPERSAPSTQLVEAEVSERRTTQAPAAPKSKPQKAKASESAEALQQPEGLSPSSPWYSRDACLGALQRRGEERAVSDAGTAPASARTTTRIGTWNIRWYPDGRPGKKAATPGTDIFWLACAIAWLEVDILAVQEIKTLPRAQKQTEELLAELKRLTGQTWQAAFDDCPQQATQHVGLLWNEERVRVSNQRTEAAFNPHGAPCQDALRPGFAALVELADGSRFELISVHLKSGAERRSFDLRAKSFGALAEVLAAGRTRQPNLDMVVAGDFNTMGCKKCSPQVTADQELAQASAKWAQSSLHWLSPEPGCTEYYRDKGHLLDGFVVTAGLTARVKQPVRVAGLCGELACKGPRAIGLSPAMRRLSDHCPVVLELSGAPPATTDGTGAK